MTATEETKDEELDSSRVIKKESSTIKLKQWRLSEVIMMDKMNFQLGKPIDYSRSFYTALLEGNHVG